MKKISFDGKKYTLAEFIDKLSDDNKAALFKALGKDHIDSQLIRDEVIERAPSDLGDDVVDEITASILEYLVSQENFDPELDTVRNLIYWEFSDRGIQK